MANPKKLKKFIIETREVWIQPIEIWARGPKDAIVRVEEGMGTILDDRLEYSYPLDIEPEWVEETESDAEGACERCGSPIEKRFCVDGTCPFHDCFQDDVYGWRDHPDPPDHVKKARQNK